MEIMKELVEQLKEQKFEVKVKRMRGGVTSLLELNSIRITKLAETKLQDIWRVSAHPDRLGRFRGLWTNNMINSQLNRSMRNAFCLCKLICFYWNLFSSFDNSQSFKQERIQTANQNNYSEASKNKKIPIEQFKKNTST